MALKLSYVIQLNADGQSVWITDKTGAYDATSNDTGWGAPNPELNETALAALVQRSDADGLIALEPVNYDVFYNQGADNTDETTFQFTLGRDGHHLSYLFALLVSDDGSTVINSGGTPLDEGEYFYWTQDNAVYKIESSVPVSVTDYSEMIDNPNIVQSFCQILLLPDLTIKKQDLYKEYKDPRSTRCNDDATFQETLMLQQDIQGADYAFRSGLTTESEEIIDTLLNEYEL